MSRGFVERGVDRDHEIQLFQCLIQRPTIWRGQHRVSRSGKHQADLTLSLRANFID